MKLINHHTDDGQRVGIITKQGYKWMHIVYVCAVRAKRVKLTEMKHIDELGEATRKQIAQFNRAARNHGAAGRVIK